MSLSTFPTLLTVVAAEAEQHSDPAVPAWAIGVVAFVLFMALLFGVVAFGGGREHS